MLNDSAHNLRLVNSTQDLSLTSSFDQLKMSGFYWYNLSKQDAEKKLQNRKFGDFLVRDSRMDSCLFTISTKAKTRVVHIRTIYSKGKFSIEGEFYGLEPKFDNFVSLIEYYVNCSKSGSMLTLSSTKNRKYCIQLLRAVRTSCPSLKHLCRTRINSLVKEGQLPDVKDSVPKDVKWFLSAYRFTI